MTLELARQPRARDRPVPFDGCRRDRHRLGGLFNREATEEPQFDEASLLEIECRQFLERIVEGEDVK